MYYEQSLKNRESWRYTYTGLELLEAAEHKRKKFHDGEMMAREAAAHLLKNPDVAHDSKDVMIAREAITENGRQHEQCVVFCHEFTRNPEREYHLALGDVVFFGLT